MGGPIAVRVAENRPDRIARLVLLEPNLGPGGGRMRRGVAAMPEADYAARGHAETIAANTDGGSAEVVRNASFAARLRLAAPHAMLRSARSLVADGMPTTGERLAALSMPRVLLHGSRSGVPPDARAAEAAGVRLIEVTDAGHDMMHDAPDAFAAALAAAIA
jgi:pimeloyl-ACP methyl ester carboxylesterase